MTADLVEVLEELLAQSPGADAFHVRIQDDFKDRSLPPEEVDAIFADFEREFEEAVERISEAWGEPTFRGTVDQDDFPAWSEALVLAYWHSNGALAFLSLRHDDDHEPMFIEVGALSDDEVSTLEYTKS